MYDRRDGVVEREPLVTQSALDGRTQGARRQRARRHDGRALGKRLALSPYDLDTCVRSDGTGHRCGKELPVDRQRRTGGHARLIGTGEKNGAERPHFPLELAVRVLGMHALEGVRADQFAQVFALMCLGATHRSHFKEGDTVPRVRKSERSLASG